MNVINPKHINKEIEIFCKEINPNVSPVFIEQIVVSNGVKGATFSGVEEVVSKRGGEIEFGWRIWECKGYFLEAEPYKVWKKPTGKLVDVVAKSAIRKITFLLDNKRSIEIARTIRKKLSDNILVDYFCSLADKRAQLINIGGLGPFGEIGYSPNEDFDMGEFFDTEFYLNFVGGMLKDKLTRESLCPCGKGEKFKNCHEKRINELVSDSIYINPS